MKKIKEYLTININESQKCGVCSSFEDDDVIKASFKGDDYLVSRHALASGNYGSGPLHFAKLVDDPDEYWIVKLSKTDKIQERYSTDAWSYGHEVENYYCPACGKKLK